MQKFKFPKFYQNSIFRVFPVNFKEIPISEGAMRNFRNFQIFWDPPEPNRMENYRMHLGTDGRTDRHLANYYFCKDFV